MRTARAGLFLLLILPSAATAAPARAAESEVEASSSSFRLGGETFTFEAVKVGLKANTSREANARGYEWGPTLGVGVVASDASGSDKLRYELEYAYGDESSKLTSPGVSEESRVRTSEVKFAKLSLLKVHGYDLKERLRFVPYAAAGMQYADSRSTDNEETTTDHFWSPTWGAGIEFALGRKTTLSLDYEQNTEGGGRHISRLSLELKFDVVGSSDE